MTHFVSVDLDRLISLGVYPRDTVLSNPRFRGDQKPGPTNAPFYRLEELVRGDADEILATPTGAGLMPYDHAKPIDIQAAGLVGEVVARVNTRHMQVKVIHSEQVTFIEDGFATYQHALRQSTDWLQSGTPKNPDEKEMPPVTLYVRLVEENPNNPNQSEIADPTTRNASEAFSRLPTEALRELLEGRGFQKTLSPLLTHFVVDALPLSGFELDPENYRYPEIGLDKRQLADLVLETGRIEEFGELGEGIIKMGSPDSVDRFTSIRAAEGMLEAEPELLVSNQSSPSP